MRLKGNLFCQQIYVIWTMKMADTTTIIRRNRPGTKAKVSYFNDFFTEIIFEMVRFGEMLKMLLQSWQHYQNHPSYGCSFLIMFWSIMPILVFEFQQFPSFWRICNRFQYEFIITIAVVLLLWIKIQIYRIRIQQLFV